MNVIVSTISILILLTSCTSKEPSQDIYIDISIERIFLDGKPVSRQEVKNELKLLRDTKVKAGIKPDQITINLRVIQRQLWDY